MFRFGLLDPLSIHFCMKIAKLHVVISLHPTTPVRSSNANPATHAIYSCSCIIEIVPTKWAAATIRALEPLVQTYTMEGILTGPTLLIGCSHIRTDDTVTDRALALSFECALHVSSESHQAFNDRTGAEYDDLESP